LFLPARELLVQQTLVSLELGGEASKRRRAFACGRTQMRHHTRIFIQDEPHGHRVHFVHAAGGASVELCGDILDALQVNLLQMLRAIRRRRLAERTRVAQDSSQLREASRGAVHRA
jgi:hypothetical protein